MRKPRISFRSFIILLAMTMVLAVVPSVAPAQATGLQQNEIILSIIYDGLQPNGDAPFAANTDGVHTPGDDDNQNNNVVLANDLVGYRIDWNVNEVDGTTTTITATLPEGMAWQEDPGTGTGVPTGCVDDATSSITGNSGRDLVCNTDAEREGSNGVIRPVATAGSQYDNTPLTLQAFIGTDQVAPVGSNEITIFSSARPKADWIKGADVLAGDPPVVVAQEPAEELFDVTDPATGEVGRIWVYPLRLVPVGGLVGAEKIDDSVPIEFFDHAYDMPAGAKLATGLLTSGTGAARTACGAYDGVGEFATGSVGTWTCTDETAAAGTGYPVTKVVITAQDTSVAPAVLGNGGANTAGEIFVGQIAFFVPESSFSSFPIDVYNAMSGTIDPIAAPTDIAPVQVAGSGGPVDEAGVVNNYAYWKLSEVPITGAPGRSFMHTVKYNNGPYQEVSRTTSDGRIYRGFDMRLPARGGLSPTVVNTANETNAGWGVSTSGPMAQITPRGNELVISAELDHTQNAPTDPYYFEASSLCVTIDPTHQEIVALPALIDVNHLIDTSNPYIWQLQLHDLTTQEAPNTGPLAQVQVGAHPTYTRHIYSFGHGVETTLVDIPYVVEFATGLVAPDQNTDMHEVTCNNGDVTDLGWVDSAGDLSVFDANSDGRYEGITHVRLRVTGPMQWRGTEPNPTGVGAAPTWGTSINLNLQIRVKDDPLVNQSDQELFVYASRAFTPATALGSPDDINVWDPATQANPGTETCTNTTNTVFNNHYGDGIDYNTVIADGWCNLPFEDDGASSNDLTDNPYDFGGGGEDAWELAAASNGFAGGFYPRMVHADKVSIVEADTSISKVNLAGANDVNQNGDLVEFEIRPAVVGSNLDTLSDIIVADTLPANYEFVAFTQLPATTVMTDATTAGTNDGVALATPVCGITGQAISCDFGTQVGGWSDTIRYQVRLVDAGANATITNTVGITANDALSGLAKSRKTAQAKSFTPDEFDESGIIKMVDRHIGSCGAFAGPGDGAVEQAADCSLIAADSSIRFTLDAVNEGLAALDNYRVIDVLPHSLDVSEPASVTLTGDGRTPESAFGGTVELVSFTAPGATVLYSADPAGSISRDPDVSEGANTWCDAAAGGAAVFGAGACPAAEADVTAVYANLGTLAVAETRSLQLDLVTAGNDCGDLYTNSFGARTDSILLPIRSNDVSALVGFCEPSIDIEKDTNGVQADNIDEDVNGNGLLDDGEDTNDVNGVLDVAAPAGSNVGPGVPIGGAVTWTYVVTNGDVALLDATVADSDPAVVVDCDIDGDGVFDGTNVIPVLLPLAEITCQATGTAIEGQYSNDSSVVGTPVVPTAVDPSIDPDDPSTWPADAGFDPTDESTWPLDPAIDLADPATWPTDPAGYGAPVDPVTGETVFPATLEDTDPSHYWGVPSEVGVDIEKDTNGVQADANPGPSIEVGDEVTWTYVVTNTGQLPITPATVADSDPALSVVCDASLADAGGDDVIDIFQPGESVTCTATGVATGGNYANTATVSGPTSLPTQSCVCDPTDPTSWPTTADALTPFVDPETGEPVTVDDADDSHYNGAAPAIDIEKDTNGVQSDEAPGEELIAGSTVTWTYEVTNTGATALANATVSDDQGVTITCEPSGTNVIAFLLPGDSATCTATGPAIVGGYTNNATVSGTPQMPDFTTCDCDPEDSTTWPTDAAEYSDLLSSDGTPVDPVTDEDPSNYTGVTQEAGIDIEKSTNGVQSDEAPGENILVGSTVTWTYEVTNTGDTALANATVSDSQGVVVSCAGGSNVIALLLPGETVVCEGTGLATGGLYTNDSTVSGDPVVPDFGTCGCDPADSTTWPTDAASFQPAIGEDGLQMAPVDDADPSNYTGVTEGAAIDIEKSTNGVQSDEAPGESLLVGSTVTWTYDVTNTGTTALANATVTDSQGVDVSCAGGSNVIALLLPGETVTCEGTGIATGGAYTNDSTVVGDPVYPDFSTCDCDLTDSTTWPTDAAGYETAVGEDGLPLGPVDDADPSNYTGVTEGAAIDIEKSTNGVDSDEAPGEDILVGSTVTWTYDVTNTGSTALANATVADSQGVTVSCAGGSNVIALLVPGQTVTCEGSGLATGGAYTNDSTVTGDPVSPDFTACGCDSTDPSTWPTDAAAYETAVGEDGLPLGPVDDADPSNYTGVTEGAGIAIEKSTNGVDSDEAPGEQIIVGAPVTWTYDVTNLGTTALANATVTDSQGVEVSCAGGSNVIPLLLPGQTVTCEGTGVATGGVYTNDSTVTGDPVAPDFSTCGCDSTDPTTWPTDAAGYETAVGEDGLPLGPVDDADPSSYTGVTEGAAIDIEKSTNGVQSDEAPGETILVGSPITWTYDVTNTGTTALADATVADSQGVEVSCAGGSNVIALLVPGQTVTCEGSGVATGGSYMNDSTVSGDPISPDFSTCDCDPSDPATWPTDAAAYVTAVGEDGAPLGPVDDADPSHYTGVTEGAGIDIEKSTNGVDSDEAPGETLAAGSTVTWTYVVTNTGTTALADATVSDDQGVEVSCDGGSNVIALLLPGQSVTCEGTGTAVGGPYVNNAAVAGNPVSPDFSTCDCDPNDPATWPTDAASFVPAVGSDGSPLGSVDDADPSHYTGTQAISGTVWDDANSDGLFDASEATHAGVLVALLDADGNPVLDADGNPITALTDEDGFYSFNVAPGDYQLSFTAPEGLDMTTPGIIGVTVEAGVDVPNLDAGLDTSKPSSLAFTGGGMTTTIAGLLLLTLGLGLATIGIRRRRTLTA